MKRSILVTCWLVALSGCQALAPGVERDVHTGVSIAHAAPVRAGKDIGLDEALYAQPYFATEGGYASWINLFNRARQRSRRTRPPQASRQWGPAPIQKQPTRALEQSLRVAANSSDTNVHQHVQRLRLAKSLRTLSRGRGSL